MLELLAYDRAPSAWRYTGHIVLRVSEPYPGKSLEHVRFFFLFVDREVTVSMAVVEPDHVCPHGGLRV